MAFFADMVKVGVTGTPGTGTITLGSAQTGFQTFAAAGVPNGAVVSYSLGDTLSNGVYTVWEVGRGTYNSVSGTLTRGPLFSSSGGSAVALTSSAVVWLVILADDLTLAIGGNTAGANTGQMADLNLIGGQNITLSGSSNSITISGAATAASGTAENLVALGNTTGATSSSALTLTALSVSGAGGASVGLSTTAAGKGVLIVSGATTAASGTAENLVALGNTTGATSSSVLTLTAMSVSGAGVASVGLSTTAAGAGVLIVSVPAGASGTVENLVALGNTTAATSSSALTLSAISVSGAGNVSVGLSTTAAGQGVLVISGSAAAGGGSTSESVVAVGNTTGATSSSSLSITNWSISGAGGASVGFSTTAAGAGVIVVSGATTAASGTVKSWTAIGNTTGLSSSTTATLANQSISGAGIVSVGMTTTAAGAAAIVISATTAAQSVQTIEGFAVGLTTGSSSNTTFDARSVTVSGAGVVSVGYSSNNVLIISAPAGGSGTAENMVALGNTVGATSSSVLTLTALSVSGAGGASVGFSTTAAGAGVLVVSGGAGGGGGTSSFYALGNTTAQSSSSTITGSLSISGVGALSVGYSTTAVGAPAVVLSAPNVSTLSGVSGISVSTAGNTISLGFANSLSYFEPYPLNAGSATSAPTVLGLPSAGVGSTTTMVFAPMNLEAPLVANELRVLKTYTMAIMAKATSSASYSASASMSAGITAVLYSQMGGSSSNSYTSFTSDSNLLSLSQSLSGTSTAYTNGFSITYPTGTTTSSSFQSGTSTSTVALASTSMFSAWREVDFQFPGMTLMPGNYILGLQHATLSGGASALSLSGSFAGFSRITQAIGRFGSTTGQFFPGVGSMTVSSSATGSGFINQFDALQMTSVASNYAPYFYLINVSN